MTNRKFIQFEIAAAKRRWSIGPQDVRTLKQLIAQHRLSIAYGDVIRFEDRWYVTHSGLLRCARRRHCSRIDTILESTLSDPVGNRWVFKATVYLAGGAKSFTGYGDADPSNVSAVVHGAEMRVAETRAVNRALRKAYGIGLCSVEELGAFSGAPLVRSEFSSMSGMCSPNGNSGTQPRLRDQLCLTIRRFHLDPNLVKSYAADFCGTESLSQASRESVQAFINHLNKAAEENRDALLCKLNSFAPRMEVQS